MKSHHFFWLLLLLLAGLIVASSGGAALFAVRPPVPILHVTSHVDLGERKVGEEVVVPFALVNRGGAELVVHRVQMTGCSCATLERREHGVASSVDGLRVGAGEQADVVLKMQVRARAGRSLRASFVLHTNDPERPEAVVEAVVPRVRGGVATRPTDVGFGTLVIGGEFRQTLEVVDEAVPPRTIERVSSSNADAIVVSLLPPAEDRAALPSDGEAAVIARLEVVVRGRQPGNVAGHVFIRLAGEPDLFDAVPVAGRVVDIAEIQPSVLVLPRSSGKGFVYDGKCLCRSTLHEPLTLSVESADEGLEVRVEPVEGNPRVQSVRVEWDRQAAGDRGGRKAVRFRARVGDRDTRLELPVLCRRGEASDEGHSE
jgi:hypothetical protein